MVYYQIDLYKLLLIEFIWCLSILTKRFYFSFTSQSYVSAHPSIVLLDPLPAMTQLLDRFASYRIMTKLHNSLRGKLQRRDMDSSWLYSLQILAPAFLSDVTQTGVSAVLLTWRSTVPVICHLSNRLWLTRAWASLLVSSLSGLKCYSFHFVHLV